MSPLEPGSEVRAGNRDATAAPPESAVPAEAQSPTTPVDPIVVAMHPAPWSPGRTITTCHGVEHNGPYVVVSNFVVGSETRGGLPLAIVPSPVEETYLGGLAIPSLGPNESAIMLPLVPGYERFCREEGILDPTSTILELPYKVDGQPRFGFPHTELFSLMQASGVKIEPNALVVSWFTGPMVQQQITELGAATPQVSNSLWTNNKTFLRERAPEYGIRMSDGVVLKSPTDIDTAASMLASAPRAWLKLSTASGGDAVVSISAPVTAEEIRAGVARLHAVVEEAFLHNDFGARTVAEYWGSDDPTRPPSSPTRVTIETDVRAHGEFIADCSNMMLIHHDGRFSIERTFKQRVTEGGAYQGSQPFSIDDLTLAADIQDQMTKIARFCVDNNMFGIVGVDYFVVRLPSGELQCRITEINARPPVSATAVMLAEKLGAPAWINANVWTNTDLLTMADFETEVTFDGVNHARATLREGRIVPIGFRTLYGIDEATGEKVVAHPSKSARMLICGEDQEQCERLLARFMEVRGARLQAPAVP